MIQDMTSWIGPNSFRAIQGSHFVDPSNSKAENGWWVRLAFHPHFWFPQVNIQFGVILGLN